MKHTNSKPLVFLFISIAIFFSGKSFAIPISAATVDLSTVLAVSRGSSDWAGSPWGLGVALHASSPEFDMFNTIPDSAEVSHAKSFINENEVHAEASASNYSAYAEYHRSFDILNNDFLFIEAFFELTARPLGVATMSMEIVNNNTGEGEILTYLLSNDILNLTLIEFTGNTYNTVYDNTFNGVGDYIKTAELVGPRTTFSPGDTGTYTLRVAASVPEPTSLALVGLGLVSISFIRRRKQFTLV